MKGDVLQRRRRMFQVGFFLLFLLAPPLDLLRLDLTRGHAVLLGMDWTLGIDALSTGEGSAAAAVFNLFWRGFLPLFGTVALLLWVAWRYGRLYCGWLCPHFSVVETINGLMRRASGRPSIWERTPLPQRQADGSRRVPNAWYWLPTLLAVGVFAFLWAVALLTYLLPPAEVYGNLVSGQLTLRQGLFIGVATLAFSVEFLFARHLFCRFGCAVGLFQSLSWMSNDRAMVVGFDRDRADRCHSCNNACDNVCPMRLKPRTIKRKMFTCTECAQCISACTTVQGGDPSRSLLRWVDGADALSTVSARSRPSCPGSKAQQRPMNESTLAEGG
ncbi:MAG: 4Fe-4S binding protein [Gammaproteobacteria bacterium]|nr:4Fe-4S binding protein [Gammaproteobacteria bacterium]